MKLEVGMYVRTKYGISKIEEDRRINYGLIHPVVDILKKEVIIKASHNIIDLIEEGDYVNGFPVIHKENDILKCGLLVQFKENEIKSIVTKEQFEQMQYKVGE